MARDRLSTHGPAPADPLDESVEPSQLAELEISVGPDQRVRGRVPPEQAHHLVTMCGILGSVVTGTGGVVLTLNVAPSLTTLAFAQLALALVAAVLIAASGRIRT
jgi:hypothetical protein